MIPIIIKGGGFKGLGAYLLHDGEKQETAERVEWTFTHNTGTEDAQKSINRMCAVAMSQDELKASAGVKATGRKTQHKLAHVVLSWHETDQPTREQMQEAGLEALKTLGVGEDHQAVFVAHNDTKHRHLHIVINRISMKDGKALSLSNDQRKLSEWASDYQKRHGQDHCPEREKNAEKRKQGEKPEAQKRQPRHLHELHKTFRLEAASNDNLEGFERFLRDQKRADRELKAKAKETYQSQRRRLSDLAKGFRDHKERLWQQRQQQKARDNDVSRRLFDAQSGKLKERQKEEWRTFYRNERTLRGRLHNVREAIKTARIGDRGRLSTVWHIVNAEGRKRILAERHQGERDSLFREYRTNLKADSRNASRDHKAALGKARDDFQRLRGLEIERAGEETAAIQQAWKDRKTDRERAYQAFRAAQQRKKEAERTVPLRWTTGAFTIAAESPRAERPEKKPETVRPEGPRKKETPQETHQQAQQERPEPVRQQPPQETPANTDRPLKGWDRVLQQQREAREQQNQQRQKTGQDPGQAPSQKPSLKM